MKRATFGTAVLAGALAPSLLASRRARAAAWPAPAIELGDDVFLRETWRELHGRCVGVVTNQTGVTARVESVVDAIRANSAICLRALYAPEHGLRGDRSAGAYVPSYVDERSGLPVHSLYGPTRRPSADMLAGVDVLLFDIQDVGDRAYTYISTLAMVMQAAKAAGKEVWVLDRPNPIGGDVVEGPVLEPRFASFIGLYPLALRHGLTVGELAHMYNDHFGIGCTLKVVAMRNWRRSMLWSETGLAWVQTSPNIPEWDTTLVYPTTGMIDAAGINNGSGFTKPFKFAGAYHLDGAALASYLNARPIPGVHFRSSSYTPASGFWAGKTLTGVELLVFDGHAYRAVRTAVEILAAVKRIAPGALDLHDAAALDKDWGTDSLRLGLNENLSPDEILRRWEPGRKAFEDLRARYLLYEG
jgi:uncharacterized protein YbbC (DUF1343 family)